jgi:general secretion pathway protein D
VKLRRNNKRNVTPALPADAKNQAGGKRVFQQVARSTAQRTCAIAAFTLIAVLLAGCEPIQQKYARRHVTVPTPVTGPPVAPAGGALKPAGVLSASVDSPRDALVVPEYYYGSGNVVAEPLGRPGVATDETGDMVSLNFIETGILEVVDVVLSKTLGLNYVIDSRVQGMVTARTSKPIPRPNVLPVLENILALNGAALVESDGVYNIVPVEAVASLPKVVVTPSMHPQRPGVGIHVIPLEFASVASVQDIVASQISPGHQLAVDHARNILIYTGPAREAAAIAEMVSVLDIDILAGMSFALFPIQTSNAQDIAAELEALFSDEGVGAVSGVVRFLPIERLNAVLAIASRPAHLKRVGEWVERLDRADAEAGKRVFVYYAKNSRASDLADILNQVFEGSGGERSVDETRSVVAPGLEPVELFAPARVPPVLDESAGVETPAAAEAFVVEPPGPGIRQTSGDSGIRFVADERNNAVVVIATAEQFRMIEATLKRLDILPLQVLIEATIAEVRLNDELKYGLQWAFESGNFSGSALGSVSLSDTAPAFSGFNMVLDTGDVRVVLNALSEVTDVEVVSSPQLMVLDNQQARLQVGDQVPIATQSAISTIADAPIVNSIQYFDTGVILEVTPRVNASGLVTLDILQEVSDAVLTESSLIDSPTIQQRSIRSIVAVQSGETVALGGLIRERSTESVSGIPVLMEIPLLGNLFKTTGQDAQRTELLVLITPRVIRGAAEARSVTEELRQRLTTLRDVVATGG